MHQREGERGARQLSRERGRGEPGMGGAHGNHRRHPPARRHLAVALPYPGRPVASAAGHAAELLVVRRPLRRGEGAERPARVSRRRLGPGARERRAGERHRRVRRPRLVSERRAHHPGRRPATDRRQRRTGEGPAEHHRSAAPHSPLLGLRLGSRSAHQPLLDGLGLPSAAFVETVYGWRMPHLDVCRVSAVARLPRPSERQCATSASP